MATIDTTTQVLDLAVITHLQVIAIYLLISSTKTKRLKENEKINLFSYCFIIVVFH